MFCRDTIFISLYKLTLVNALQRGTAVGVITASVENIRACWHGRRNAHCIKTRANTRRSTVANGAYVYEDGMARLRWARAVGGGGDR